jgi:hypothetical protein
MEASKTGLPKPMPGKTSDIHARKRRLANFRKLKLENDLIFRGFLRESLSFKNRLASRDRI